MKRRALLTTATASAGAGLLGMGAAMVSAPRGLEPIAYAQSNQDAAVDRVVKAGKVRLGVDLSLARMHFRDPQTKEPKGYEIDVCTLMAKDLGVEIEWVEMPFAQLVPGMLADKFDWSGIGLTITPTRAKSVRFVDETLYTEDSILLIKKGFVLKKSEDLNSPNVTIAVPLGSAQGAAARLLWPKAQFRDLGQGAAALDVASGRSTASLTAAWLAVPFIEQNPSVRIWEGGTIIHDIDTFMVPDGDEKTSYWISNWMRYSESHRLLDALWKQWMGDLMDQLAKYSHP